MLVKINRKIQKKWRVSTGGAGYSTPARIYRPKRLKQHWKSIQYSFSNGLFDFLPPRLHRLRYQPHRSDRASSIARSYPAAPQQRRVFVLTSPLKRHGQQAFLDYLPVRSKQSYAPFLPVHSPGAVSRQVPASCRHLLSGVARFNAQMTSAAYSSLNNAETTATKDRASLVNPEREP